MGVLSFPSWMTKAPAHPGESKWGNFSADQWRTFCTHILPVTLIRLWGNRDQSTVERQQLDNFMHLVSAVKLATMRTITEARVAEYEYHIYEYLRTLLILYPNIKPTAYHHLVLHFGDFLRGMGPSSAYRCFNFERYNYILQKLPTNRIFGNLSGFLKQNKY